MSTALFDLLLVLLLAGALVCVSAMVILKATVPSSSDVHTALFQRGTFHPYSSIVSMRAKYFLPWISIPAFSGVGLIARWALVAVRVGAYASFLSLLGLIALGLSHA
jgi:hypothetical protein